MNILKLTDKPAELEAVRDKVLEELQFLRSLDTAGDGGRSLFSFHLHQTHTLKTDCFHSVTTECYLKQHTAFLFCPDGFLFLCPSDINVIKNQINSLLFVKKVCETRIQRLQSGKVRNCRGVNMHRTALSAQLSAGFAQSPRWLC